MVRLAIAGIGSIANMYIWLIASGKVPSVRLTALCSRSREAMEQAANRFHLDVKLYQDYEELLSSGDCDAVLICTPHGKHPAMTKQALLEGIPVLVEKPVGIFTEEVEECLDILKKDPKLVCGVMYNRRASKAFHAIKKMVDSGEIGELVRCSWIITDLYRSHAYHASSPWRGSWAEEGGGLLMTQASHQLDLLQWICGMPREVLARCRTVNRPIAVENEAELLLTFPNGARGQFLASSHEFPGTNLLEICGTKGKITLVNDTHAEVWRMKEDEREFTRNCREQYGRPEITREVLEFFDGENGIQQAKLMENFARAVLGEEKVLCPLEEGLKSLHLIQGAYVSSRQESAVALPLEAGVYRKMFHE